MPRPPTPWFKLYAEHLLTDPKIRMLSHEELGVLLRLWSWMWVNDVKRGTLLLFPKVPISEDEIAKFLEIDLQKWNEINDKLVNKVKILKRGTNGELYSARLRNFKTDWELYGKQTRTKQGRNKDEKRKYQALEVEVEVEKEKDLKPSDSPPADSNSTTVEKLNTEKPNWKEIQNRQIDKTQKLWKEIFGKEIPPNQLQLLVWGSKKQKVHGFKSYEALWVWMGDCKTTGWRPDGSAFLYAKTLAKDHAGVKAFILRAWGKMQDAQAIADVFDDIKIRHGRKEES